MKRVAIVILLFLLVSWLYCTLILEIDFEQDGYAELVLRPYRFIGETSEKVKGVYDFFTEKPSWLKNLEDFFGDGSLFDKIRDFFDNQTGD